MGKFRNLIGYKIKNLYLVKLKECLSLSKKRMGLEILYTMDSKLVDGVYFATRRRHPETFGMNDKYIYTIPSLNKKIASDWKVAVKGYGDLAIDNALPLPTFSFGREFESKDKKRLKLNEIKSLEKQFLNIEEGREK